MGSSSRSQPCADGALPVLTADDEPSAAWEERATEAVAAVEESLTPLLRKAADSLYDDLLFTVQDYLLDNVLANVRSKIEAAERQANYDRQRAIKAEHNVRHLSAAVRMCVRRIENPELSPDANVVVERARALLAAHGEGFNQASPSPIPAAQVAGEATEPQSEEG